MLQISKLQAWGKHYHIDGMVTQHLSPYEQAIVSPMFKDAHKKILKQVQEFLTQAGGPWLIAIGIYTWAEQEYKDIAYHHRV